MLFTYSMTALFPLRGIYLSITEYPDETARNVLRVQNCPIKQCELGIIFPINYYFRYMKASITGT